MKQIFFVLICACCVIGSAYAQLQKEQKKLLQEQELLLRNYADSMINDPEGPNRFYFDSLFTRTLVQALRTPHSFDFPFDSVIFVSRLYAPDSSFRIFSWQLMRDFTDFRYKGAIQMKTPDGSLKLIPLYDNRSFTANPVDSIRGPREWIGALYYDIIMTTHNNKKYYTLFGFEEHDARTRHKWMEVMTIENGQVQFGGRFFNYPEEPIKPAQPAYRFYIGYKKEATASMRYNKDMNMVLFDHLISESNEPQIKYTLIPDGDYEGFVWRQGKWNYVRKPFTFKLQDGEAPTPAPLFKTPKDEKKKQEEVNKKTGGS